MAQDSWLVNATAPSTRRPGLGALAPPAGRVGARVHLVLARDRGGLAVVLFGDRCAARFGPDYERVLLHEVPELAVVLDDQAGAVWLNRRLEPYHTAVDYLASASPSSKGDTSTSKVPERRSVT